MIFRMWCMRGCGCISSYLYIWRLRRISRRAPSLPVLAGGRSSPILVDAAFLSTPAYGGCSSLLHSFSHATVDSVMSVVHGNTFRLLMVFDCSILHWTTHCGLHPFLPFTCDPLCQQNRVDLSVRNQDRQVIALYRVQTTAIIVRSWEKKYVFKCYGEFGDLVMSGWWEVGHTSVSPIEKLGPFVHFLIFLRGGWLALAPRPLNKERKSASWGEMLIVRWKILFVNKLMKSSAACVGCV